MINKIERDWAPEVRRRVALGWQSFGRMNNVAQQTTSLLEAKGLQQSFSGSETDVSNSTSTENLTPEEKHVLRHSTRQEPQGEENTLNNTHHHHHQQSSVGVNSTCSDTTLIIHNFTNSYSQYLPSNISIDDGSGERVDISIPNTEISASDKINIQNNNLYGVSNGNINIPHNSFCMMSHEPVITSNIKQKLSTTDLHPPVYENPHSAYRSKNLSAYYLNESNAIDANAKLETLYSHHKPVSGFNILPPPPDYPKAASEPIHSKEENIKLCISEPDLSDWNDRPKTRGCVTVRQSNEYEPETAEEMFEALSAENIVLKEKLGQYYKKVSTLQRVEGEVHKVHNAHEELVKSSEKRERLERAVRMRFEIELKRLQANNKGLKAIGTDDNYEVSKTTDNSDVDYEPMESDNETIDSYESDDVDLSEHEDDGVMLSDSWKRISDIFSDCRPNSLPELVRNFSGVNPALNCNANNSVLDYKELVATKERQEVELSAQRGTLQEQRTHIDILDNALTNAQANVVKLEEECRKKHAYVERVGQLQNALNSLQIASEKREAMEKTLRSKLEKEIETVRKHKEGKLSSEISSSKEAEMKKQIRQCEEKIIVLEAEVFKWEQRYLEESAMRQIAIDNAATPKDARIAALEKTSQESEKMIAESRSEKLKQMDELYQSQRNCAAIGTRIKDLESKLAEKEAMIKVLQKQSVDKNEVIQSAMLRSPRHSPHPSILHVSCLSSTAPMHSGFSNSEANSSVFATSSSTLPNVYHQKSPSQCGIGTISVSGTSQEDNDFDHSNAPTPTNCYEKSLDEQLKDVESQLSSKDSIISALRAEKQKYPNHFWRDLFEMISGALFKSSGSEFQRMYQSFSFIAVKEMKNHHTLHRCGVLDLLKSRSLGNQTVHNHDVQSHLYQLAEDQAACGIQEERVCQLPTGVRSTFLMAFSPDKSKVASTHGDHKIYVSDIQTGKCLHTLYGHPRTPWCIAFHPTYSDILASGCLGGHVRVWDLHGGSELWISDKKAVIASLAFHPTEKLLVIATSNELYFWDWRMSKPLKKCKTASEREKVRFIKFDPTGNFLITGIANRPLMEASFFSNGPNQQYAEEEHDLGYEMLRSEDSGQMNAETLRENQRNQTDRINELRSLGHFAGGCIKYKVYSFIPLEFDKGLVFFVHTGLMKVYKVFRSTPNERSVSPTQSMVDERREVSIFRNISRLLPRYQRSDVVDNELNTDNISNISNSVSQELDFSSLAASSSQLINGAESQRVNPETSGFSTVGNAMSALSQTLISSLRRLHAALQLMTDDQMNIAWTRIPNGRARMLRIVTSILNRLNNLVRNSAATYDSMNMRTEINQEINHIAEQFLRLPTYGGDGIPDNFFTNSNSLIELNQRLQEVIVSLMQSLERITALELQYRSLGLMSSAVVSSPMPASSLNWRDERTVTILPNPFSQENINSRSSSNSNELSLVALAANNINSRLRLNASHPALNQSTLSSMHNLHRGSISNRNSERMGNSIPSSSGSYCSVLRRKDSARPDINISVEVNQRDSHGPVRERYRNMLHIIGNGVRSHSSKNSTPSSEGNEGAANRTFDPHNHASSSSINNSTTSSENNQIAHNTSSSLSTSLNQPAESHSRNLDNLDLSYSDGHNPLSLNFTRLESNSSSTSVPSTSSDINNIILPDENSSSRSIPSEHSSSSNNDVDDLMDAALTIQNSSSLHSASATSNSSDLASSSSSFLPDIREHFRNDQPENLVDSSNGIVLNVSASSAFRVPQVHIDPVDGNEVNNPPIARPRSPPMNEVIARNLNLPPPSNNDSLNQAESLRFGGSNAHNMIPIGSSVVLGPTHLHPNYTRGLSHRLWEDNSNYNRHVHSVLRRAIDRVISGVGSMAETALGGEILTHRIQKWRFTSLHQLEISSASVVVPECKIHNDASVDISSDGSLLATLVPIHRYTNQNYDGTTLGIFSLKKESLGQCLYTWSFGIEAITVSLSPLSRYIMIGLASCRTLLTPPDRQAQTIARILKIECDKNHHELVFVQDLAYNNTTNRRQYLSLNAACWLPSPGDGIIFGTNRGDLRIRYPRHGEMVYVEFQKKENSNNVPEPIVTLQTRLISGTVGFTTASTQTVQPDTISIATQTSNQDFNI
ncbi:Activating molecule in BECN1-regulated autophagy protein 1 [Nymphon striatum]|nr:Activating molecule in BECN1-regulated autophagy protein 1 [Nymphon striatum]